jgi:hypothetical protein
LNIVAGEGSGNMEELMQHYAEERRRRQAEGNGEKRILEQK